MDRHTFLSATPGCVGDILYEHLQMLQQQQQQLNNNNSYAFTFQNQTCQYDGNNYTQPQQPQSMDPRFSQVKHLSRTHMRMNNSFTAFVHHRSTCLTTNTLPTLNQCRSTRLLSRPRKLSEEVTSPQICYPLSPVTASPEQPAALFSSGNSSWSCSPTRPARDASLGLGMSGSSRCQIQMRWPGGGASARTSPR